jgi:hypothetical protein
MWRKEKNQHFGIDYAWDLGEKGGIIRTVIGHWGVPGRKVIGESLKELLLEDINGRMVEMVDERVV